MFRKSALALCAAAWIGLAGAASAQTLENLSIVIFGPPSLGAFLPPVIKAQKIDEKNGLSITFVERTPDAYTAQFNSGEFQLGGSASLLTVGQADVRGVKIAYLFNLFDFWGAVVTSRPEVKTLRDLEGKELAAARGTTNFLMFDWFARQQGVDPAKLSVVNTATPGLVGSPTVPPQYSSGSPPTRSCWPRSRRCERSIFRSPRSGPHSRAAATFLTLAWRRISTGSRKIAPRYRSSMRLTKPPPNGPPPTRMKPRS
jgi:hypothetical protein